MKTKIVKVKSAKKMEDRLAGKGTFRITGPSKRTGKRVTVEFEGTREEAEMVELK